MSVCDPCTETEIIPSCVDELIIGTIAQNVTDVYVYVKDITTGRLDRFDVTSDGAGVVTIEPGNQFMPSHSYEIWITLATATSIEDMEDITIDGATYTCLALRFTKVIYESYTSITIDVVA